MTKDWDWEDIFYTDRINWNKNSTMLMIDGKSTHCPECGANVFKLSLDRKHAKCNGCQAIFDVEMEN